MSVLAGSHARTKCTKAFSFLDVNRWVGASPARCRIGLGEAVATRSQGIRLTPKPIKTFSVVSISLLSGRGGGATKDVMDDRCREKFRGRCVEEPHIGFVNRHLFCCKNMSVYLHVSGNGNCIALKDEENAPVTMDVKCNRCGRATEGRAGKIYFRIRAWGEKGMLLWRERGRRRSI